MSANPSHKPYDTQTLARIASELHTLCLSRPAWDLLTANRMWVQGESRGDVRRQILGAAKAVEGTSRTLAEEIEQCAIDMEFWYRPLTDSAEALGSPYTRVYE